MLALDFILVIAGAIKPKMINGTVNDINCPRINLIDWITPITVSLQYNPITNPTITPRISFKIRLSLIFHL